ncbi:IS3 family transposase, partial [Escherichia coli]|uniref:IS3 family transposase n=1 Tax=Escherichia coli TaxID=562 RepID=UPI002FE25D6D
DRNRSHWSTSKTPSYTKSVSWQHHHISELKDAVTEYIEYYNSRRISLKLKGLTPIEYRNQTYMPRV